MKNDKIMLTKTLSSKEHAINCSHHIMKNGYIQVGMTFYKVDSIQIE